MPGVTPTSGFNDQLVEVVQHHRNRVGYEHPTPTTKQHPKVSSQVGFLQTALAAATDPRLAWDSQPTATVDLYRSDALGTLGATGETLTVYSKKDSTFEIGTYVEVEHKGGQWQLIDANCLATTGL